MRDQMREMSDTRRDKNTAEPRVRTISWSDPGNVAEIARSTSGIEFVRKIMRGEIPPPPVMDLIGFTLIKVEPGEVAFDFEPAEMHYNPMGGVHGGIVSTVLDSAMGLAVLTELPPGSGFSTLELKVNFVRAISLNTGALTAEGKVIHLGSRIATAEARFFDRGGKLHAHSTTTCLILRESP